MELSSCLEEPEKNRNGLAPYKIVELFIRIRTSGLVYLPVKLLGPFEHVHEGMTKWFKYCRLEFYSGLQCFIYDKKQQLDHEIKDSPRSALYMKNKYP